MLQPQPSATPACISHTTAIDILYAVTEAAIERIGAEDADGERLCSGLRGACTLVRLTMPGSGEEDWGACADPTIPAEGGTV